MSLRIDTITNQRGGAMNALFPKDLAAKTRRGLRDRIEAGKSGGGWEERSGIHPQLVFSCVGPEHTGYSYRAAG